VKIFIKSNFVLPGLEKADSVEFDAPEMTLRDFLEKLAQLTSNRFEFIERDSLQINQEDWGIEINGKPYQIFRKGLDHPLRDEDTIDIMLLPIGGG
jgi:hypothetical protein